jgi:release factor glutamine methyltransferase
MFSLSALTQALHQQYPDSEIRAIYRLLQEEKTIPDNTLERLLQFEPVQYILGYTWFYNRKIEVNQATLIPRPETEELCEIILHALGDQQYKMLDVGTGSGCIPVTICAENNRCHFQAIDISAEACRVASNNASKHGVIDRIQFQTIDFLTEQLDADYDIIISNPPYISAAELKSMDDNVLRWEPHSALFAAGDDPLVFFRHLEKLLRSQNGPCVLFAEINASLAKETVDLFSHFDNRELLEDMSGNNRFVRIKKEG